MQKTTLYRGAFLALCLIGMLVLPAAAAPSGQASSAGANAIDQGLKDDLWNNHKANRLETFDMHVRHAESTLAILGQYGIDTTACEATLSTIEAKRTDLQSALDAQDRQKLKTVNAELKTLWQQFLKDVREAIRSHYGTKRSAAGMPDDTAEPGTVSL
jgi:hypothetical protein